MIRPGNTKEKVLVFKDEPNPVVAEATKLDHMTLLLGIPIKGRYLKPLLILPRLTMPPLPDDILSFYDISGTDSGWINGQILKDWVENQLLREIQIRRNECNYQGRCLIILDNHTSRDFIDLDMMANEHQIDFLRLPPHSSASMQPLDLCPNGELKKFFSKNFKLPQNANADIKRSHVLRAAMTSIDSALSAHYANKGWEKSGLYPFNPNMVISGAEIIYDNPDQEMEPKQKCSRGERFSNRVVSHEEYPPIIPVEVVEI